jgi:hypothetical protein
MGRLVQVGNLVRVLREVDLEAIRRSAEDLIHLALVGAPGAGKTTLTEQMRSGGRADEQLPAFVAEYELPALPPGNATAAILVVDAALPEQEDSVRPALERLQSQGAPTLICLNKRDLVAGQEEELLATWQARTSAEVILVSARDREALMRELAPAVLRLLPGRELALARALPLFRRPVAQRLIEETSLANAGYSLTTGIAEIVPVLTLPLTAGDLVVLTKNQAIMAYKIALAMGLPSDWRETLPQLGAVIGGGFMWRQIARELVGLIPIWGIVPKVAVAYAGTRVTGLAVYHWAATGEKLTSRALRERYRHALDQGRALAKRLLARRRAPPALPTPVGSASRHT